MQEFPDVNIKFINVDIEREEVYNFAVMSIPVLVNPNTRVKIQPQANKDSLRYTIEQLLQGEEHAE